MEKLPIEWVDRIFERLECIYQDRWTRLFPNDAKRKMYQVMWSTGLAGIKADQIRHALTLCKLSPDPFPPTVIEFYHYAKGIRGIPKAKTQTMQSSAGDAVFARSSIDEIKHKLSGKCST